MGKQGQIPWNKGKKLSNSHKESLSKAHMGQEAWNKGLKGVQTHDEAFKRARSEDAKKNGLGKHVRVNGAWNSGKKGLQQWSAEQRIKWNEWAKSDDAQIGFKRNGVNSRNAQKKKDTAPELATVEMLNSIGVEYQSHVPIADMTIVDFLIPSKKVVIYVDGNYWHKYPDGTDKDKAQEKHLTKIGYKVLRIWESDIHNEPFKVLKRIMKACNM